MSKSTSDPTENTSQTENTSPSEKSNQTENTSQTINRELITNFVPLSLIKAGAGAGKTYHIQKTLTEWVKSGDVKADRILAVTFTNAAANEMKERIRLALLQGGLYQQSTQVNQSTITTIHGFGLEIIERFAYEIGSSPNPRQLTEAEQNILIRLSLTQVEEIATILNDLSGWGYTGKFNGSEYTDAVVLFKDRVLEVIRKLRDLGASDDIEQIERLISRAKDATSEVFGKNCLKENTLNKTLWNAITAIKGKYTESELDTEWGSSKDAKAFVKNVFKTTQDSIANDWKLWTKLQTMKTAPRIFDKKTGNIKHQDGQLAFDVWNAADQLAYHPGPLKQSLEHIEILLQSAGETLLQYQQRKNSAGLVDFGDMVHLAEKLMQDTRWLEEVKSKYDCLIIDEFQDTNPLQFALLWGIAKAGIPTLIVGDIKQSIMGFQGADSRLFNSLIQKQTQQSSELTNNWRSSNELMVFINQLGTELYGDQYTPLTPQSKIKTKLEPVKIIEFSDEHWSPGGKKGNKKEGPKNSFNKEKYNVVVLEIKKLLDSKVLVTDKNTGRERTIRPNDIAVLGQTHKELGEFANKLRTFGLQPQITESGWFNSKAITWMLYAISYLADPRDQHALMCLKLIKDNDLDLQNELNDYIIQQHPKLVKGELVERLNEVRKQTRFASIKEILWKTIDALCLWEEFSDLSDLNGQQNRANLLKLIDLAQVFDDTQTESLQAQGIFGRGLSSFAIWLQENFDEHDKQPHVNNNNENAVVLKTWFASKGLEWPVVIVLSMEKQRESKLPSISVQYEKSSDADDMLESAFTQIFTEFDDKSSQQKFLDNLLSAKQDEIRNLTYVVMTRAREQLILPWFNSKKDNCVVSLLSNMDLNKVKRIQAIVPDQPDVTTALNTQPLGLTGYGREAIDYAECESPIIELVSPSTLAHSKTKKKLIKESTDAQIVTEKYSELIDLSLLDKEYLAHDLGTLIHSVYQVMLTNPLLEERLFSSNTVLKQNSNLKSKIIEQVRALETWMKSDLKATSWQAEVAMLAKTKKGETLSGIIDLLVETNQGYWIIDHKTDKESDDQQFKQHLPQLMAYAEHLKLNKPILGVAINWVRNGECSSLTLI